MKIQILLPLIAALAFSASAQTTNGPTPPTFIRGKLDIRFAARTHTGPTDNYDINVNVCDSAIFHGSVTVKPFVPGTFVSENGKLTYDIGCDIVNPKNPAQVRNVGKLIGTVPVDERNVYRFTDGSLKMSIIGIGNAKGFDAKFSGLALGKPRGGSTLIQRAKQEAINLQRSINGKAVGIIISKYDKMEFQNHVLASGPVQVYPDVTINGTMIYDYVRDAWNFLNFTAVYSLDGKQSADRLSGNIRWVKAANYKTSGESEYQFDVRVNEPATSESAVFAGAQDESAFFETDSSIPSLTGAMKYKDTPGDTVSASAVTIDLVGNKLTKQQAMYLCKMLVLSAIVPFNDE